MTIRNVDIFKQQFQGISAGIPILLSAAANADGVHVQATFSQPLANSSLVPSNFSIPGLTISAPITQLGSVVTLPVSLMTAGTTYFLTAKAGIMSAAGGTTQADQTVSFIGAASGAGKRSFDPKHFLSPREFFTGMAWHTGYQGPKKKTF